MHKHYRLVNRRRFFLFISMILVIVFITGMIVNAGAVSQETQALKSIRVQKGDTLWEIASNHCTGDIRKNIYKIQQINEISQGIIHEGQILLLP